MIQFVCDTCGAIKQACEAWIVGHASETVGAVSARREVAIESIWNRTTTLHPLAVHFCSVQCKDEYMDRLFVAHSRAREVAIGGGGAATVEQVVPQKRRSTMRSRKLPKKRKAA
jgi:hypothetical protein